MNFYPVRLESTKTREALPALVGGSWTTLERDGMGYGEIGGNVVNLSRTFSGFWKAWIPGGGSYQAGSITGALAGLGYRVKA